MSLISLWFLTDQQPDLQVMGGEHSLEFATFRDLVIRGFRASHKVYPKASKTNYLSFPYTRGNFEVTTCSII